MNDSSVRVILWSGTKQNYSENLMFLQVYSRYIFFTGLPAGRQSFWIMVWIFKENSYRNATKMETSIQNLLQRFHSVSTLPTYFTLLHKSPSLTREGASYFLHKLKFHKKTCKREKRYRKYYFQCKQIFMKLL